MSVCLGGPNSRGQRISRGGIVVSLQYVNHEPSIVLFPLRKRTKQAAYIICLSAVWRYADDDYLMQAAKKAADVMDIGTDRFTVYNVARAISDSLEDLVRMKPEPEMAAKITGEGVLMGVGDKPITFDLTDKGIGRVH